MIDRSETIREQSRTIFFGYAAIALVIFLPTYYLDYLPRVHAPSGFKSATCRVVGMSNTSMLCNNVFMMGDGPESWPRCDSPGCAFPNQCVTNCMSAKPPYLGMCCSQKTCCEEGSGKCDTDDGYFWCPIYEWGNCYQFDILFAVDQEDLTVTRSITCNLDSSPGIGSFWADNTCAENTIQQFTNNSSHTCFYNPEMRKVQWSSSTVPVWPPFIGFAFAAFSACISLFGLWMWVHEEIYRCKIRNNPEGQEELHRLVVSHS